MSRVIQRKGPSSATLPNLIRQLEHARTELAETKAILLYVEDSIERVGYESQVIGWKMEIDRILDQIAEVKGD